MHLIKNQRLGKGIDALLNFFGLEVQNIKITSSAKSFPLRRYEEF